MNPASSPEPAGFPTPDRVLRYRLPYALVTVILAALPQYAALICVFRDRLQQYLSIGLEQYGVLLSAGQLPGAVAAVLAGLLLQRWRPRVLVGWGLVGAGAGFALTAFAGASYPRLLGGLLVIGFFNNGLAIAMQSYLVRLFPERRRRVLTFSLLMPSVVGIIFPLFIEHLLRLSNRPGGPAFGAVLHVPLGVVGVLLCAGAWLYRRPLGTRAVAEDHDPQTATPPPWTALNPWLLTAMQALHGSADVAAWIWVPRVLGSDSYAAAPVSPGIVIAAFALAYVVSRLLLMTLPEQTGRYTLLMAPGLIGGGLFLAGVLSRNYLLTAAGYVVGAFCWAPEAPAATSELAHQTGRRFGTYLAISAVGGGVGAFAIGAAMGWWGQRLPTTELWRVLMLPAAAVIGVGVLGVVWRLTTAPTRPGQDSSGNPIAAAVP